MRCVRWCAIRGAGCKDPLGPPAAAVTVHPLCVPWGPPAPGVFLGSTSAHHLAQRPSPQCSDSPTAGATATLPPQARAAAVVPIPISTAATAAAAPVSAAAKELGSEVQGAGREDHGV